MVYDDWPHLRFVHVHLRTSGLPTFDVLFMVAMLNALEREADHIRSEMTSHYISNATATLSALSNCIEQEVVYKTRWEGPSEIALTTHPGRALKRRMCSNPNCKHSITHSTQECFHCGGPMEGKCDDILLGNGKYLYMEFMLEREAWKFGVFVKMSIVCIP